MKLTCCHGYPVTGSMEFWHITNEVQSKASKDTANTKAFFLEREKVLYSCSSRTQATIATTQSYSESRQSLN